MFFSFFHHPSVPYSIALFRQRVLFIYLPRLPTVFILTTYLLGTTVRESYPKNIPVPDTSRSSAVLIFVHKCGRESHQDEEHRNNSYQKNDLEQKYFVCVESNLTFVPRNTVFFAFHFCLRSGFLFTGF